MKKSWIPGLLTLAVILFLFAPLVMLVVHSFNASRFGGEWEGFTWQWYERLWAADEVWDALFVTLKIAVTSSVVAMVLGSLAAFALHRFRSWLQGLHSMLVTVPLVMPDILMGISLLFLFVNIGAELNLATIILAHTTFCLSYVTLVMLGRLQDFDESIIEAAQDLGAGWSVIVRRILLPLLGPGLAAGALLAFTLSIDDFVITFLVSGPGNTTLPVKIFSMMRRSSPQVINALSVIFMAVTFIMVVLSQRLTRSRT